MSKICNPCNQPIFNTEKSSIGLPLCADPCSEEIDCDGNVISTACVTSNTTLPCLDLPIGATQSEINLAIDTKICQNQTSTCTASVSVDDTCCGYLDSKIIAGDGIVITTINPGGCEKLSISETCWIFPNNITLLNGWKVANNLIEFQTPQYSNVKECVVKLRGQITKELGTTCLNEQIFLLPLGKRPLRTRIFSVNLQSLSSGCAVYKSGNIIIYSTGIVKIVSEGLSANYILSLDAISFEIN